MVSLTTIHPFNSLTNRNGIHLLSHSPQKLLFAPINVALCFLMKLFVLTMNELIMNNKQLCFSTRKTAFTIRHLLVLLLLLPFFGNTQPYVEGGKTRHRFAQLNLGVDVPIFLGSGSQNTTLNSDGSMEHRQLNNQTQTRLIIGGTHFWGHADFYIAIPVASFGKSGFSTGVETGFRYFPWRIESKKIRPYIGTAILPTIYKQGEGTSLVRFNYPLTTGLMFNYNKHLIEVGFGYNYNNRLNYYIDPATSASIITQPFWISMGYKRMIETTIGAEKEWINGNTKRLTDTLASQRKLNGFTLAAGPSASFFLKTSSHNRAIAPYIDNHKSSNVFADFGLGYYLHHPDLQFNLAYRGIKSTIDGYGFSQTIKRKALTLEVYKFIGDYHGFVPFIGPALSYEHLNVQESDQQQTASTVTLKGIKPGITFGWDIRPNRLQAIYLRTNLRWFPNMNVKMSDGNKVSLDQLEFNFIQLVVFPGRFF